MKSISLNTFENDIQRFLTDFSSAAQFNAFKKCYFQLLLTREDIKTTLQAVASIQQLIICNDEQHEFLVDSLANAYYFLFEKKQALEHMKTQLTNSAKIQTNKTEKLKQKLLNSMAKVDKIQLQLKRRLKKICEERSEMKHKLDQMKAIVDGFEGELQETEVEMSSLKTDLTFSNIPDESSENSELMERFYNAQKAFEDRKASCLQKKAIKEQQMSELKAVEMKIRELQKRKTDTVKVIPQRNQSDFTLNQSAWDF